MEDSPWRGRYAPLMGGGTDTGGGQNVMPPELARVLQGLFKGTNLPFGEPAQVARALGSPMGLPNAPLPILGSDQQVTAQPAAQAPPPFQQTPNLGQPVMAPQAPPQSPWGAMPTPPTTTDVSQPAAPAGPSYSPQGSPYSMDSSPYALKQRQGARNAATGALGNMFGRTAF